MIYFAHGDEEHEALELASSSQDIRTILAVGLIILSGILIVLVIKKLSSKSE